MPEPRDLLERVANRVEPSSDAFDRLARRRSRRHRNRRIGTGALALLLAAGGTIGAFAAFNNGQPPPTFIGPQVGPGNRSSIPALWPETTRVDLGRADARVASGRDKWRLSPKATAVHFAHAILRWQTVYASPGTSFTVLRPGPTSVTVRLDTCDPTGHIFCAFDHTEFVTMQRLGSAQGLYSVTAVDSPHLLLQLASGEPLGPETVLRVKTDFPDGEKILAAQVQYQGSLKRTSAAEATISRRHASLCVQGEFHVGRCEQGTMAVAHPTRGYVAFLRGSTSSTYTYVARTGMFPLLSELVQEASGPILDLTARPVTFVPTKTEPSPYPRGAFETCPGLRGAIETDGAGADEIALRFSRLWAGGRYKKARRFIDPSARKIEHWAADGDPTAMRILNAPGKAARHDGLVRYGCGPDVADRSWEVVIDDGTDSSSLDFTIYLVRRHAGWRVWGSY